MIKTNKEKRDANIPTRTKKRLLKDTPLNRKDNNNWYIEYKTYSQKKELVFMSFNFWLNMMARQESRNQKLTQLGI